MKELKQEWREFKHGRPGQRFEDRFERSQKNRSGKPWFVRFLKPILGLVLFAGGIVLCFIPGPGIPLILIGVGLLADFSRPTARGADWLGGRARSVIASAKRWWRHASPTAKYAVVILGVFAASGAAYGGYWFLFER